MTQELYKRYRPTKLSEVVGQNPAVATIVQMGKRGAIPHTLLLTGPSGCGKTTIARILRDKLDVNEIDYIEMNASESRGIDMVRQLKQKMMLSPLRSPAKMYVIDECQSLTNDAQEAFLKILEDTPAHVYFVLCTTDPQKLKKTVLTRCTEVRVQSLDAKSIESLLKRVAQAEGVSVSTDLIDAIVEAADGSARKALVLLDAALGVTDPEEQIKAVVNTSVKSAAFEIAKALMSKRSFSEVAPLLKETTDDAESIRRVILGYCRTVLLNGGKAAPRAFLIIDIFRQNFYDSGAAGLAASCWEFFDAVDDK